MLNDAGTKRFGSGWAWLIVDDGEGQGAKVSFARMAVAELGREKEIEPTA
jgi:superoxide dismutase